VHDDDLVDTRITKQLFATIQRGEQEGRLIWSHDRHRMRPKGHGNQACSGLACPGGTDELGVSSMDSIEIADHHDGRRAHPMRLLSKIRDLD
jgi:hypothetical protein